MLDALEEGAGWGVGCHGLCQNERFPDVKTSMLPTPWLQIFPPVKAKGVRVEEARSRSWAVGQVRCIAAGSGEMFAYTLLFQGQLNVFSETASL